MISAIVAVDNDWGIGYNGELLEYIPEDLKFFKELTLGNTVIMGSKTWDSLPEKSKPLPKRCNIIVSPEKRLILGKNVLRLQMIDVLEYLYTTTDEVFIIGGGSIYKQLLPYCNQVYITKIYKDHKNIDTYFPNLDETNEWVVSPISEIKEYNGIPYQFLRYERNS